MYTSKQIINYSGLGIAYAFMFAAAFFFSTSLETIPNTVSWYLPAGVRLAFYVYSPIKSWPFIYLFSRIGYVITLHPGGLLAADPILHMAHPLWYLSCFIMAPGAVMLIVWSFRRIGFELDFSTVSNTLKFFLLALVSESILVTIIFGRQAIYIDWVANNLGNTIFSAILGNIIGILTIIPFSALLFHWFKAPVGYQYSKLAQIITFWIVYISINIVLAGQFLVSDYYLKVIAILPAVYCSYRFGWFGAVTTVFFICLLIFITAWFDGGTTLANQFYIISMSLTCLLLGAAKSESEKLNKELLAANTAQNLQNQKLAEILAQNRNLSAKLIDAQEDERKRLSYDLHDDFGQRITDIKLTAHLAKRDPILAVKYIPQIIRKAESLYTRLKTTIDSLRPKELDDIGLLQSLKKGELSALLKAANFTFNVTSNNALPNLTDSQNLAIYRICQESINNSLKHSKATVINITFTVTCDSLNLDIIDNGIGFVINDTNGYGLISMRERAFSLGASFTVRSDDKGTTITIDLPL